MSELNRGRVLRWSAVALVVTLVAGCSTSSRSGDGVRVLTGSDAFGDWRGDAPGVRRLITAQDLPPIGKSKPNESKVVPTPAGAAVKVPAGFTAVKIVSGLAQPRAVRLAPNGDLFVSNSKSNEVRVVRLSPGTGLVSSNEVFASDLNKPYGIAFYPSGASPQWVYIANADGVVRFPYKSGDLHASAKAERIVEGIPTAHHWTRDIAFSADGQRLYLAVGSGSNVALDMFAQPREPKGLEAWNATHPLGATWDTEEYRANILSFDPLGKNKRVVATGLRNPSGIAIQPATGHLWTVVNERDGLGDDLPFEYATRVQDGAFYGWPWYYIGSHEDPRHPGARPDLKDKVAIPDVLLQAHSSALQIAFCDGAGFPASYKGSAFVTLHGSWDRDKRTGYKVVRLLFDPSGKATGEYEDFMTGFVVSDKEVWGRPVGVAVSDGSVIVTEDGNGSIWRITYHGSGGQAMR